MKKRGDVYDWAYSNNNNQKKNSKNNQKQNNQNDYYNVNYNANNNNNPNNYYNNSNSTYNQNQMYPNSNYNQNVNANYKNNPNNYYNNSSSNYNQNQMYPNTNYNQNVNANYNNNPSSNININTDYNYQNNNQVLNNQQASSQIQQNSYNQQYENNYQNNNNYNNNYNNKNKNSKSKEKFNNNKKKDSKKIDYYNINYKDEGHSQKNEFYEEKPNQLIVSSDVDNNLNSSLKAMKNLIQDLEIQYTKLQDMQMNDNNQSTSNDKLKEKSSQIKVASDFLDRVTKIINNGVSIENKIKLTVLIKREINRCQKCLPTYLRKNEILSTIKDNKFSVIIGETGSGKSTQIVQYIYDDIELKMIEEWSNTIPKQIVVTEPRKLATSIYTYIAEELFLSAEEEVISKTSLREISYQSPNAKIIFYTDRMMVEEIVKDKTLSKFSHVIIDEAHERNLFTDIIIGFLKQVAKKRNDLKVIITSATIDEDLFSNFYNCPVLKVSGKLFPVKEKFLDFYPENEEARTSEIKKFIENVMNSIPKNPNSFGHVLIFTAGLDDINKLTRHLNYLENRGCIILPLHGKLSSEETRKAFAEEKNKVKVILATRIAETSITINNIKYVIDFGYDKENYYDVNKKMNIYKEGPITQAAAKQRMGRAGRTTDGICLRLYDEEYFGKKMNNFKKAEILRSNISIIILKLKQFKINDINNFDFIEKPPEETINNCISELKLLEALSFETGEITYLGERMADLPTEPWLSKIAIEGENRAFKDEVLKIISVLVNSHNLFFTKKSGDKQQNDSIRTDFADEYGDLIMFLNIFNWAYEIFKGKDKKSFNKGELIQKCREKNLSVKALLSSFDYYDELNHALKQKNIINQVYKEKSQQKQDDLNDGDNDFFLLSKEDRKKEIKASDMLKVLNINMDENLIKDRETKREELKKKAQNLQDKSNAKLNENYHKEEIIKCFLSSLFQNISLYSGSKEIGYTLIREMENINIYNTSSLFLLENYPKWIITYEITKTENKSLTKVASMIDIKWIHEVVPRRYLEFYKIADLDVNPIYKFFTLEKVSTILLRGFLKPLENPMMQIDTFLEENKITCKANMDNGSITFWALSQNITDIKTIVEKKIENLKSSFEKATRDHPYNEKMFMTFEKGLSVVEIAEKGKSRNFKIVAGYKLIKNSRDLDRFLDKYSTAIDQTSHLNSYQLEESLKKNKDKEIEFDNEFLIRINVRNDAELIVNRIKQDILVFKNRMRSQDKFTIEPSSEEVEYAIKEKLINISIDFIFFKGYSEMKGVVYGEKEPLERIKKHVKKIDQTILNIGNPTYIKDKRYSCFISGLNILDDEIDLYKAFQEVSPEIEYRDIIVYRKNNIPDFEFSVGKNLSNEEKREYYSIYTIIEETSISPKSIEEFTKALKEWFGIDLAKWNVEFCYSITTNAKLQNESDEKFKRSINEKIITFNVNNLSQASEINKRFSKEVGMFGHGRCHVLIKFKSTVKVSKEKYRFIEPSLREYSKLLEIERRSIKITMPNYNEEKGSNMSNINIIIHSENNMQDVLDIRNDLSDFIKGQAFKHEEYFKALILFNTTYIIHKESIQKQFNVFIEDASEYKEIRISGDKDKIKLAETEMLKILKNSKFVYRKIDYTGKSIAPLFKNKKELLLKISSDYRESKITVDIRNKCILIYGKQDQIIQIEKEIEKVVKKDNYIGNECGICFGQPNNPYKAVLCTNECKPFCKNCLEELVLQVVDSQENLPLKCPSCLNCISLRDIKILIKFNDFKKLMKFSLNKFVNVNNKKYKFCPKPGCESVVKIRPNQSVKEPLVCEICKFHFCLDCNQFFHPNISCEDFKLGSGVKKCPNCNVPVFKAEGCNHMTCASCRIHFCWTCLKHYRTAMEVYKHMEEMHGDFVLMNYAH